MLRLFLLLEKHLSWTIEEADWFFCGCPKWNSQMKPKDYLPQNCISLVLFFFFKLSPQSTIYLMSCSLLCRSNCASLGYREVFPFIPNTVVCMYVQVCKCSRGRCSHVCLSMWKIRGQMSPSFTLPLVFWYKVLHWMWSLLQLHPQASKP